MHESHSSINKSRSTSPIGTKMVEGHCPTNHDDKENQLTDDQTVRMVLNVYFSAFFFYVVDAI